MREQLARRDVAFVGVGVAVLAMLMFARPVLFFVALCLLLLFAQDTLARLFPGRTDLTRLAARALDVAPWAIVAAAASWMLFAAGLPLDDLLRHTMAKQWGFDYASRYEHHIIDQRWSYWIGFDWAVGTIHQWTGDVLTTTRWVRAIATLWVGLVVVAVVRRLHPDPVVRCLAVALIMFGFLWFRLALGRPEILACGILLAGLVMSRTAWLFAFCVLAPTYWLAGLYAMGALALGGPHENWRRRLALNVGVTALALVAWAALWWFYSGGELLRFGGLVAEVAQTHARARQPVGELLPLVNSARSPLVLLTLGALLACCWTFGRGMAAGDLWTVLFCLGAAAVFTLPDYSRYGAVVWTLFAFAALSLTAHQVRVPARAGPAALAGVVALTMMGLRGPPSQASQDVLSNLALPTPGRVLTPFNPSNFLAAAANPESRITPIFDTASTREPYRSLVTELSLGRLDCGQLQQLDAFDYVIENTLTGPPPACLRLLSIDGKYRTWEIPR